MNGDSNNNGNSSRPTITTTETMASATTTTMTTTAFDDESVAMVSQRRLQRAVAALLRAEPAIQTHPAVQQALQVADWLTATPNKKTKKSKARQDASVVYLNALASCLVHDAFRWAILKHLRAFALDLLARLMDGSTLTLYEQSGDAFVVCSDNLKRREAVAGALVALLAFLPQTKHQVLQYFVESPCFFEFVSVAATQPQQSTPVLRARLGSIVQIAFRLLHLYPQDVAPIWNWASFYPLCFHDDLRVRWYASRATALVLRMSNTQRNAFLRELQVGEEAAVASHHNVVRQIEIDEHRFEIAHHQQRVELVLSNDNNEDPVSDDESRDGEALRPVPFHETLTNVFGVVIPTKRAHEVDASSSSAPLAEALVPTASTKRNLQAMAIALGLKRPVLIAGSGGCGKTAVIRELARLSGNNDMVELHLDDQIDSKTLLGSYVCTDIPGEFTWQPGALTTAVLEGRWVVIEDIDRAPFEVLAALMPLLETREMVLPGRGELLVAHSNFQIFATTSHGHNMPKGFQESIWARVDVQPLHDDEVEAILTHTFSRIPQHVVTKIMTTFNAVSGKEQVEGTSSAIWKETRRNYGRDFSLRDLLKWCKRIYSFCYTSNHHRSGSGDYVTEDERLRIVVEACDVFCAGIRDPNTRVLAAIAVGSIWQVQEEKIRYMMDQHKPTVKFSTHEVEIGRVHLPAMNNNENEGRSSSSSFVMTGHVLRLLEKLAAIVHTCEPALLIGETGCGKTTVIQHLAASMGQTLVVQNLNIQSDSSDLVGGFKPVELHLLARPLYMSFVDLFTATFSQKSNAAFLNIVRVAFEQKDWKKMSKGMKKALQMANAKLYGDDTTSDASKMASRGASLTVMKSRWDTFDAEVSRFERQKEQVESHFAFAFVEGVLVKALREGHWVLLDEINLASSDTLERISTLLEHEKSAFSLTERGDVEIIRPHPNFRLFGAMNPSTDVGKKDLPPSLRNRFTEIYVDECVSPTDLQMVVQNQFREIMAAPVMETVRFYLEARKQAEERLSDGARHKPRYSLRTLSQALQITRILIQRGYGMSRALYEGFSSTFCTLLDLDSRLYLDSLIKNTFAKTMKAKELKREPPCPGGQKMVSEYVLVSSYWVRKGDFMDPRDDSLPDPVTSRKKFVLTPSVDENLRHVARAALIGRYPVLLQGPTSAGKTSLISYLAARIGQKCVRINNHEHTDIQEYLGSYVSDSNGKLTFKEGVLVEAVRNGWWIILDELNLAPSEVLEALNRLLDDNRELFLPETQETVKPHPKFMLFATQNPPGLYGGRKVLSRAFRNRFMEIQVDEAPTKELQVILQERSSLPPSYCGILIDIMRQLQMVRQQSSIFAGKSGFITTRDLLRWAERRPSTKQALAEEGYCLLAERLRKDEEKEVVKKVIEQKCNVKIDIDEMYYRGEARESNLLNEDGDVEVETVWGSNEHFERVQRLVEEALTEGGEGKSEGNAAGLDKISVTKALRRLFALVGRCLQHEEPILLVGETGCGKTTVCQLYSLLFNQPLHIINCHQHTETSDFLGCLRPVRGKEKIANDLHEALVTFLSVHGAHNPEKSSIADMLASYETVSATIRKRACESEMEDVEEVATLGKIEDLRRRYQSIFEWCDGPLVESMKKGDLILIDEVNLAEDAVLERLNSVLEPTRTLLLAEKGGDQVEEIVAHQKWRVMATMNPGGDFGKRELSPALRNRFTEIWVPAISDLEDIATIIRDRLVGRNVAGPKLSSELSFLCDPILAFVKKFNEMNGGLAGCGAVTLRDILSWINFICSVMKKQSGNVSAWTAFVQGAALSVLDGLGLGSDKALHTALKARDEAYEYLLELVPADDASAREEVLQSLHATKQAVDDKIAGLNSKDERHFGIGPFMIPRGPDAANGKEPPFSLRAPTTMSNLYRVLRAMQVSRPIILEGSPGVGKTSLISALAAASGHRLVRINLSEQTDISDLFGSDLPAASNSESGDSSSAAKGMFEWCDGVFLRALKAGDWVLLDELNLASQSVLEGLNSCLDHRGTVYIPELDREFECPPTFRVFAAQNPLRQGGGRKGLPKSFLNRFTRVFVDMLHEGDLTQIATSMYPQLNLITTTTEDADEAMEVESTILERMIKFNSTIHSDTMEDCTYGRLGAPWEFNLRDVFRFCELIAQDGELASFANDARVLDTLRYYVNFIYVERMRSSRDRAFVAKRFAQFFGGAKPMEINNVALRVGESYVQIGRAFIKRREDQLRVSRVVPPVFNFLLKPMEALIHCVNMSWPALLVGPPGSGKTSAVRLLAALTGNKLHELGMSAGTDATELLGCFEQVDLGRKLREHRGELGEIFDVVVEALLRNGASAGVKSTKHIKQARHLTNQWFALVKHERDQNENTSSPGDTPDKKKRKQVTKGQLDSVVVELMLDIIAALVKAIPAVGASEQLVSDLKRIEQRTLGVVQLSKASASSVASSFEWVDGTLIQAMDRGEWILLDNVNFCSSSVLDRLNSLMETGGELLINECGVINGKLRVIKPHPNFRIFLAMDPQFGEVSRAMRNRCVEIALVESADEQPRDLVVMASAAGVPGFKLGLGFQRVHRAIEQSLAQHSSMGARMLSRFSRRHLENWAMLSSREMERGVPVLLALDRAFDRVYGSGDDLLTYLHIDKAELLNAAFSDAIDGDSTQSLLALPAASTFELCQRAESVMLKRDFAYVDYLLRTSTQHDSSRVVEDQLLGSLKSSNVLADAVLTETDRDIQLVDFVQFACEQDRLDVLCPSEEILKTAQRHITSIEFFPFGGATLSVLYAPFVLRRVVQALTSTSSRVITEEQLLFALETLVGSFVSTDEGSADASAYLLYRYLRSLLTNKSYKACALRFRSALNTLLTTVAPHESVAGEQFPVFLSANEAAYRSLETLVSRHRNASSEVAALWDTIVCVQTQLELLDGVEWLRFCEEEQFHQIDSLMAPNSKNENPMERSAKRVKKQTGFDGDMSSFSVLQQSYAVHQYHADRSSIANSDVVFLIYPLLKSFDAWMATVLERASGAAVDSVKRVIRDRFEFSIQMRERAFDWTHFLIHWQVVKKSLHQIPEELTKSQEWNDVVDMQQRINDAIEKVIGCASHKNTLWKRGGHALLPRSGDLWHAKHLLERLTKTHMQLGGQHFSSAVMGDRPQQVDVLALLFGGIASMEAAMKSGQLDVSELFYVDAPTRREILHALCAFSFVTKQQEQQQRGSEDEDKSGHVMMAEELIKVPDVLLKKLDDSKTVMTSLISSKTLYLSELEDTSANQHLLDFINSEDAAGSGGRVGRDAPIMLFDMKESANLMSQLVNFQLAPLKEHALARQEVAIIGQLLHVVNVAQTTFKDDVSDNDDGALELVRLIRDAMTNVEVFVDGVVEVGMRSPTTFHAYQDIVWCGHHFTSNESMPEGTELITELRTFVGVLKSQLNSVLFGFHSSLRENSFNSMEAIALEIFDTRNKHQKARTSKKREDDDVDMHHKVVYGLPRVFQSVGSAVVLRSISEVELHQSKCATIETQVRSVRMQKIKEHLRSAELRQSEHLSIHLATRRFLKELFVFTVTAFDLTFNDEQNGFAESHELLLRWLSNDVVSGDERKQLMRMLRSSTDVGFSGLADKFAVPLLDHLTQPIDTERESLLLGQSLILIGLWRFLLFLPSTPVDPVTKPLVKKEMLMNRVAMQAIQTAVDGAIDRLAPRTDSMGSSDQAKEARRLTDQVRQVSVFAIQRYNPEHVNADGLVAAVGVNVFGDLFRDLLRFQKTIMPVDKLLGFVSVVRSLNGRTKSLQVLRELEMFQQTTDNFAAQLTKRFGTIFYDIVEPIVASIGSVKEGVAMLAWHIQHNLQQGSVPDADKSSMALALMRFPRSPVPIDDSNNEVFGLIRLVGSKASALAASSGSLASKKATDVALLNVALIKMAQQFKETLAHASSLSTSASFISSSAESVLRTSKVIFDLFLTKWQEQKQREEEKRLEEEALFKYRTRNVEIESEDQLLEEEFRQQFPDYVSNEFSVFLTAEQAAAAAALGGENATVDGELWINDALIQELCEMHTQLYAAVSASGSASFNRKVLIDAFARGYSLAVNMRRSINSMVSAEIEHVAVGSSLFAASLVESRLHVGQAPSMSALNSDYIRGIDFHRDPLVKEAVLAVQPIQNLLFKVQRLLARWPEHAILQQIVLIADRIRNFEISSPLVRTLTAIELLVRKAQEWESYAAREFSISDDLKALSMLITRWRKLELYSWPHLLHVKEKQHRGVANKTWFNMYSLLTAQFEGDADMKAAIESAPASTSKKELQWLYLNEVTNWVFVSTKAGADSEALIYVSDEQKKWRSELFSTLDAYVRSCPMGQYESRLLIVYAFCSQLFMEVWHDNESDASSKSAKRGLANVLYNLYRYYAQHLGFLDRQWSALKAPIQKQLIEFVKICKWDEQTYYSLEESAEKSHRKLMKFVRDYDALLSVTMQTVIDASSDNNISKEGGYSGIVATKTELDRYDDSVFIPAIETPKSTAPTETAEGEETPVKEAEEKKKVVAAPEPEGAPSAGVIVVVTHAGRDASTSIVEEIAPSLSVLSSYASKIPGFVKRVGKYTKQQILSLDQVKQRQLSREICEDICSTIFYRMALLQNDGNVKEGPKLPKGSKKKALIDLLAELKAQGLSYHRMQLPQEQQQMEQLFALDVPDVENCIQVDGLNDLIVIHEDEDAVAMGPTMKKKGKKVKRTKKLNKKKAAKKNGASAVESAMATVDKDTPLWLWRRADDYYYRFVSQISSLRFASLTQFSHDLSSSEVDRMNGYAENMLYRMVQHRQMIHASSLSHENLLLGLTKLHELHSWKQNYLAETQTTASVPVKVAIEWQKHQQGTAALLREPLRELEIVVSQVLRTSSTPSSSASAATSPLLIKAKFDSMLVLLDEITSSFESRDLESGRVLRKSLGVPGIPYHASLSSDELEREGNAGLVAFAHPQKRIHGVSPLVVSTSSEPVVIPVSETVLRTNSEKMQQIHSMLWEIRSVFSSVAPTASFDAVVSALDAAVKEEASFGTAAMNIGALKIEEDSNGALVELSMKQFAEQYDKLVSTVLVAIQELTKEDAGNKESPEGEDEEEENATLREQLLLLTSSIKNARIHPIATQLHTLLDLVSKQYAAFLDGSCASPLWRKALIESLGLLEAIEPMVVDMRGISRQLLADLLVTHKSVTKLDYILIRIFRNLFQHGFCRAADEKDDGEGGNGDGKTKFTDDVEGTGMGEGEGKKDVSNEIEDEEQLLGLKGDENEQKPPEDGEKPEDTGLEMQNDFEGTMHDVPDDEKDDNDDKNSDDEEELDREMGDFDQDDENVVDEKKWGDDSDDDEDDIDKENEKFEEDSRMDQSEALEDEIRGKDDDETPDDKKKKDKEDDKAAKEKEPATDQQSKDEDMDEGGGSDEDEDDEEDKKDPVNDDFEDNHEEKHDQVDPNSRDGEQEEEKDEEGEQGDELPENMQLDDGEDDGGDDGDDGDDPNDADESMSDVGDETNAETHEEDDEEQKEDEENDEPLDNSVQLGAGGLDDEVDAPEDEEAPEPEKDEIKTEDDTSEQQKSASAVAGTQSKDGVDEIDQEETAKDEAMDEDPQKRDENDANDEHQDQTKSSSMSQNNRDDDDKQEWRPSSQVDAPQENDEQKRNRRKQEPNPYRNPQNAQEHWKRRVEMIKRDNKDDDANDNGEKRDGDEEQEMTTAELLDDDEEMEDAQHALAPAEENQVMNQQNQQNEEDEEDSKKDEDRNDGAGASAMEIDDDEDKDAQAKDEEEEKDKSKHAEKTPKPERNHKAEKDKMPDADADKEQTDDAKQAQATKNEDDDVDMDEDSSPFDGAAMALRPPTDEHKRDDDDEEDEETRPMPKLLSAEEVTALRDELDSSIATWSRSDLASRGAELWSKYTAITMGSSQRLCEQLRLVLEPMLRAKLEGDFRTGKRINMRKVIPYIASQFRKDKIWMRRTRPSKRAYQIMVAIDDSESMADNHAGRLALEAMATLCKALTQLEVGEISVVKFGEDIELLHAFDTSFTDDAGSRVITQFGFQQKKTNMITTLDAILQILETAKLSSHAASASNVEFTQIVFLISDGRFDTDGRSRIKKLIEKALEQQQLIVLLVVDQAAEGQSESSILETKSVTFAKGKVEMVPYLENYPFPYYAILPTSVLLPEILSDSLRQWFEMLQMKQ